jgi:glutamate racemase
MIPLFRILNNFNHEYIIFWDNDGWPYEDKTKEFVLNRVEKILNFFSKI